MINLKGKVPSGITGRVASASTKDTDGHVGVHPLASKGGHTRSPGTIHDAYNSQRSAVKSAITFGDANTTGLTEASWKEAQPQSPSKPKSPSTETKNLVEKQAAEKRAGKKQAEENRAAVEKSPPTNRRQTRKKTTCINILCSLSSIST